jgi:4-amino-4-deoxy-L-arabinose transferase-like glycosyltransferase
MPRPIRRLALPLIILLAFALRVFRLGDAVVWWDEGFSVWEARMGLGALADRTAYDVHPPFYYWLLHFWRLVVGDGEFQLRFLSVIFGALTLVLLWTLARWLLPRRPGVALAAVFLYAISRYAVWWSQEIRMYALVGFLALLSLYALLRLREAFRWRWALTYVLATAAALLSLYTLAFLLIVEGLYWLWSLRRAENWRSRAGLLGRWALLQIAVLAFFLPWLAYALPRMWRWSVQDAFDPGLFWRLYATMLHAGVSTNIERYWPAVILALLIALAGVILLLFTPKTRRQGDGLAALLMMLIIPPLAVWLMTSFPNAFGYSPRVQARYFYPFAATYYLLIAWAIAALTDRLPRARTVAAGILVAGMAALSLWGLSGYYAGRYLHDEYQSAALTLDAHVQPDDAVFLHTDKPWPVFAFYWPGDFEGWPNGQDADPAGVEHWVAPLWEAHEGLWLVINEDALRADHDRLVENWLSARALAQHEWRFGPKRVLLFARTPERAENLLALADGWTPPPPDQPLTAPGLSIIGWEQPLVRVKAGDLAQIAVTVQRDGLPSDAPLSVALGKPPLAVADSVIPAGSGPVRLPLTLVIPPDAPAGRTPTIARIGDASAIMGWVEVFGGGEQTGVSGEAQPDHTLAASFGDPPLARLLGYDLDGAPAPGGALTLTLYWRVENATPISWKVFVHLIGADGRPAAQGDDFPLAGQRPTTSWQPGEIIRDSYTVKLPADMPPGDYPLRIGFYDPASGVRLAPVLDAEDAPQPGDQVQLELVHIRGR